MHKRMCSGTVSRALSSRHLSHAGGPVPHTLFNPIVHERPGLLDIAVVQENAREESYVGLTLPCYATAPGFQMQFIFPKNMFCASRANGAAPSTRRIPGCLNASLTRRKTREQQGHDTQGAAHE
eukprot:1150441-Pelagomonas_calceolata.AAC.2